MFKLLIEFCKAQGGKYAVTGAWNGKHLAAAIVTDNPMMLGLRLADYVHVAYQHNDDPELLVYLLENFEAAKVGKLTCVMWPSIEFEEGEV